MSYKRMLSALALAAFFLLLGQSLFAQSAGTGALTGTVTDPSGAIVPNVTVTLTNTATGQVRTVNTGADGVYRFALIPPGTYGVKFAAAGFKVAEVPSVQVQVTETPVLNQTLEVGQQAESVVVEAQAAALQTADSTLGTTVTSQQVVGLPLSNRNYTQLLSMAPGAQASVNNATNVGRATMDISVNGVDPQNNNYQMDGVSIVNTANTGSANDSGIYTGIGIPNPDAIQEFKIQTSTYDASYGSHPGANVNVVTRSGSNTFHGGVWEFFRNSDLNANSFFDNRDGGGKQQIFNQNQVGGSIGGPVKKDKLFFYSNYQETRQINGYAGSANEFLYPLPQDRTAANLGAALCPANHPSSPGPYKTFLGLGVQVACDGSDIGPVALAMLNLKVNGQYYIPGNPTGQYGPVLFSSPDRYTEHQTVDNVDYVINSRNTFGARFFWTSSDTLEPIANNLPGTPITLRYNNIDSVLKLTTLVTNTFVNELHVSGQRNGQHGSDTTPATPQSIGQATIVPTMNELPVTVIFGGPSLNGSLYPSNSPTDQMEYGDQISWTHGRHTIRAGYEFQYSQWPITFAGLERGFLFYGSFADWLIGRAGCTPGDASCSVANPGNTNGAGGNIFQCLFCVRSGPTGIVHNYVERNHWAFVQDDWKVNRKLTLNLGVRWEYDGSYSDKYGNLTNFWVSQIQTVPVPPSGPTTSGPGLVGYVVPANYTQHYPAPPQGVLQSSRNLPVRSGPPLDNLAPRIGFAFQPKEGGKLVIRGGFGMFYDRIGGGTFVHGIEQGYPYAVTLDYSGSASYAFSSQNPYPSTPLGTFAPRWANFGGCQPTCLLGAQTSNLNTPSIDEVLHTPLTREYNLNFQYEFLPSWVLEVGYVGSSSLNLIDQYHDVNAPLLASPTNPINGIAMNTAKNAALRVPILGYGTSGFQVTAFDGMANYNSLQVSVRKQFSHGLFLQGSYTWSKDLSDMYQTNASGNGGDSNYPGNLAQQYGPVTFNRPQRFIINYRYDLPFGTHKGALGYVANGWSVQGVTTVQNGSPFTITDQRNGTVFAIGTYDTARAQMAAGSSYGQIATAGGVESRLGGPSGGSGYLNASAFGIAPVAPFSPDNSTLFGNSGIGIIQGPGQFNWDISIFKNTKITERHQVELRFEFFNAFNHAQFGNPAAALDTPSTFGQITATTVNPRIVQLALKYNF
ncbi:MAG TPA: carboxypeptidase regulatory-like domain-containing protein [Bryobacteraceae bacterium]